MHLPHLGKNLNTKSRQKSTAALATIREKPFPLPTYWGIDEIPVSASAAQTNDNPTRQDQDSREHNLSQWPTWCTNFNTFITILHMYMFRAISCSSSGDHIVLIQHLVSSLLVRRSSGTPDGHLLRVTIPDAVLIQFILLRIGKILLETCTRRGL